jgi:hypothetical protein
MCLKIHVLYVLDSEAACSSTPMATRLMADDVSTSTSHRFLAYLDLATGQTTINDVATSLGRSSTQLTCKKLHRQMSVSTVVGQSMILLGLTHHLNLKLSQNHRQNNNEKRQCMSLD